MNMKKILLFTENLGSGGAERQLVNLSVLLKERGYDVSVLTYYNNQFHESYLREHGVKYFLDTKIRNKITGLLALYRFMKYHKPDVVISYLPSPNIRMCLLRLFVKFKLVVSERSYTQSWRLYTRLKFNLYQLADYIVPNSYSEGENILSHYPNLSKKIKVIQNCIDTFRFSPDINKTFINKPIKILCVARLIPSKNILTLLDALVVLRQKGYDFVFKWVGKQYMPEFYKEVTDKISALSLDANFYLINEVDNVETLYREADYFCLPTLLEGFPNSLCEAMSIGLPVSCSNVCGLSNLVKDHINGYTFNPYSVSDIVAALEKLLSLSYKEYSKISSLNRDKIKSECSEKAFVDKYINVVE